MYMMKLDKTGWRTIHTKLGDVSILNSQSRETSVNTKGGGFSREPIGVTSRRRLKYSPRVKVTLDTITNFKNKPQKDQDDLQEKTTCQ